MKRNPQNKYRIKRQEEGYESVTFFLPADTKRKIREFAAKSGCSLEFVFNKLIEKNFHRLKEDGHVSETFSLPADLVEELGEQATEGNRTLNEHVLVLLDRAKFLDDFSKIFRK